MQQAHYKQDVHGRFQGGCMKWITTGQLDIWGRARTSETELPGLVSDLIRATAPDITAIRFPSGEKGQVRGFDGHLESSVEVLNVPDGRSLWEFGTEGDYKRKALRDFNKRSSEVAVSEQKDTTLVFVTPFTWDTSKASDKIENWVTERKREENWKDVRFIDGVQLEAWLAECPAVAAWHARNTLKVTPHKGVRSTDEFWEDFANRYSPRVTEEVLLCDREVAIEQLLTVLLDEPQQFSMIADSPDEVVAFAIASIRKAKPELRLFLEARTLVVDTLAAGRELVGRSGLIFILSNEAARSPGQFAATAPTLVPLGRQQRVGTGIVLERPSGFSMGQAMMTMGFSRSQAETLARGAGRSLAALARQIPGGACEDPPWIPDAELVLPAVLAGAWDSGNDMDKQIISSLLGADDYNTYEKRLRKFSNEADPPLDREGMVWKVRAPMDAFIHIGHLIGPEHLDEIRPILIEVFGHIPADPDPSESVTFPPRGPDQHSDWLREGLATTVLLIAVWEKQARLSIPTGAGQAFANEVVGRLPGLGSNARLLTSLKNELPLLAEAAPDPLLAALEHMLEGNGEAILPIFDEADGLLFSTSHHTGVLWALETLAWDPNYFRRASLILASLAAIDPGGKLSNRPLASLTEIFLTWHPGTHAAPETRLAVLDEIIQRQPAVGWQLLKQLLPKAHSTSSGTAFPKLREGATEKLMPITYAALWKTQSEIIERVIALAAGSAARVCELIEPLTHFPSEARTRALAVVDEMLEKAPAPERQKIWTSLRDEVRKHERFASAQWALSRDEIIEMRSLVQKYAPDDPTLGVAELFDHWSHGTGSGDGVSNTARNEAVTTLRDHHGLEVVLQLARTAKIPDLVTCAIEEAKFSANDVCTLLERSFDDEPSASLTITLAGLYRRRAGVSDADAWLSRHLAPGNEEVIAALLVAWPVEPTTWSVARRLGAPVIEAYWRTFHPRWIEGSHRLLLAVALRLLHHGRARAALQTMLNRLVELPSRLILRTLDGIVSELNRGASIPDAMIEYELEQTFKGLDDRADVSDVDIASREYALLPLVEHQERRLKLHGLMVRDPDLFHQILRDVYRGDDEEPAEGDKLQRDRWRQAYALLSRFSAVPGFDNDLPDREQLSSWVNRVRELGQQTSRGDVTESTIGRVLAHAPADDLDGGWPHRFVRDEIERSNNDSLEHGLQIERFNMRGATTRGLFDGGVKERELARENRENAAKATAWPRTAAMLGAIADSWEREAEREDLEARKNRLRS